MKPIKLTMSAFGPYKEETVIDFEKLGKNGLFLVTGDTGAGKTTIFDAISFALFNDVSGSNRPVSSLRSDFATTEETYVELTFEHKGKIYTVRRNPSYERPKIHGEGMTKTVADASLMYDDKIITKVSNVNEKITEIVGINSKQFKQIAMLAQGEFFNVLFAKSEERTEIFRKIFETNIYNTITDKLYELAKENRAKLEELKTKFETNAKNIVWKEMPANVEIIDYKKIVETDIEQILSNLSDEIKVQREEYKEFEKEIEKLTKEVKNVENKINKTKEENKKVEVYQALIFAQNELKEQEKDIKEEEKLLKINEKFLALVLPKVKINEKLSEEIEQNNKQIKELAKIIENEKKIEKQNEENAKRVEEIKNITKEYSNVQETSKKVQELSLKIEEIEKLNNEKENLIKKYEKSNANYVEKVKKYLEEEDAFFKEQAGIIAEKLEEGKPCPVCGSTEHPLKAKKSDSVLTKEELEDLKKEKEKFEKIYREVTGNYIDIDKFEFEEFKDDFNSKIKEIADKMIENNTLLNNLQKINKEKEKEYQEKYNDFIETIKELGFENEEDYKKNLLSEKEIAKIKEIIEKYKEKQITNKTKLETLEKEISKKEITDISKEQKMLDGLLDNQKEQKKIQLKLKSNLDLNERFGRALKEDSELLKEQMVKVAKIEELSKLATGKANGKRRIAFEQFVQATYFDRIINEANRRLINMTDNRYMLLRKKSTEKISEKMALDLDVLDNYNGKIRDVKSLSGGESFKAALALALGLSDIIQSYSGGVVVDTLFIDEGFGTLDMESREQAINTLIQLAGDNKLIGIISHVTELKERLDKKIIVSKTQNGSKLKVES